MISVLLVDDEPVLLDIGRMFLERSGEFRVGDAESGEDALKQLSTGTYDALVADYEMPEMDGLALLRKVRESWPDLPYILFTGRGREEVVIEALNSGADFYLQKGGDPKAQFTELSHKIKQAVITRKASSELKENEETFRQFFDAAGDAIFILDGERITDCNKKGLEILGRERDQIIGKNPFLFSPPVQPDGRESCEYIREILKLGAEGDSHPYGLRIIRADGTWLDSEITISSITIHSRKLLHIIVRDVSVRKKQEESARINEIRLRTMLDMYAMRDKSLKEITDFTIEQALVITGSRHGYLAFVNDDESALTMFSWSGGAGKEVRPEKPVSYYINETGMWGDAVRLREPVIVNRYVVSKEGKKELPDRYHPIHRHMTVPIFDRDRIVLLAGVINKEEPYTEEEVHQLTLLMSGMWGIVRRKKTEDILYKKNAELMVAYDQLRIIETELREKYDDARLRSAELAESEERFRRLSDNAPVYIMMSDETGHIIYINNQWKELNAGGEMSPDLLWNAVLHPDDRERMQRSFETSFSVQQPYSEEFRVKNIHGKEFWLFSTAIPRKTPDGRFLGFIDVSVDITDRKRVEQALKESEERYRGLIERSEDLILLIDEDMVPVYFSPSVKPVTGYDPSVFIGRPLDRLFPFPEDREKIALMADEARTGKTLSPFEIKILTPEGEVVILDARGVPVFHQENFSGLQIFLRNITSSRRMEEDIRRVNNRLTLLADITRHDIMNNLTTLNGFLDIVDDEDGTGIGVSETVHLAQDAIQRIRYLLEFTRDYQSLGLTEAEWLDAGNALRSAVSQLSIGNVQIENRLDGIIIRADPLLSRAFYNLLENSLQHGKTVSRISVYARSDDQGLTIIVEDDGIGVQMSEKKRIFQKGVGTNTGLGLFLVREIITSTGLSIEEIGQPGNGARFEIRFPNGHYR